jgi:three-Cys-motif partner protein
MTRSRSRSEEVIGSDGLRARDSGEWGKDKLEFLSQFGPVALRATTSKLSRHYVDLFAGPGLNRIRGGGTEFVGSPLRALELQAVGEGVSAFTDAWFVNRDRRDDVALKERVRQSMLAGNSRIHSEHIHCVRGDANEAIYPILQSIHPKSYVFVFADMEAPKQLPWSSVEALRSFRAHESVDLYLLFPLDMALKRLLSRNPATRESCASVLTSFFGTDGWRALVPLREANSDSHRAELGRGLLDLYLRQLRRHWRHADVAVDVRRGMNHRLYKMLFATNSDVGQKIAQWARNRSNQQFGLGL